MVPPLPMASNLDLVLQLPSHNPQEWGHTEKFLTTTFSTNQYLVERALSQRRSTSWPWAPMTCPAVTGRVEELPLPNVFAAATVFHDEEAK